MSITKEKKDVPPPDMDRAMKVARRVDLRDIRLLSGRVRQAERVAGKADKGRIDINVQTKSTFDKRGKSATVRTRFRLKVFDESAAKQIADVSAEFSLVYALADCSDITSEDVRSFGQANGVFNAWPYWREWVQSSFSRMGLPPFVVPVFRLPRVKKPEPPPQSAKEEPAPLPTPDVTKAVADPKL